METNSQANPILKAFIFLLLHAVFGAIILGLLLLCVPKIEVICTDFNLKLPQATAAFVCLSHLAARFWPVLTSAVCICEFALLVALFKSHRDRIAKALGYTVLLVEMLFIGSGMLAVLVPLTALITDLSSAK